MDGDREGVGRGWMVTGRGWGGDRMDSDREGVTVLAVTLARKVSPGLQDLQTRARRILAERKCRKSRRKHVDRSDGSGREYWRIGRTHQITCCLEISVLITGLDMIG